MLSFIVKKKSYSKILNHFRPHGVFLPRPRNFSNASVDTCRVGLLGICDDSGSSFLKGPSKAPPMIRAAMYSDSANSYCERGFDVFGTSKSPKIHDYGDIVAKENVSKLLLNIMESGLKPLVLGGDHAVSYPVIETILQWRLENLEQPSFTILHFDAHADVYDELDGNRYSHACPFARIMELNENLGQEYISLVQIGIRTATSHQREQMNRFGIKVLEMKDFPESKTAMFNFINTSLGTSNSELYKIINGRIVDLYISFDIDCLDPAFAMGVSHHEPGGMSTRQALDALHAIPTNVRVIGGDCVEYNPIRDVNYATAMVTAKICKEIIGLMLRTD